nr:HNH endonuclease family protein [Staphylococcus pettenkoferi]
MENTESYDDKYQKVYTLYKSLIDNFTVMFVETNDINEAFIIFETLNARGKDLETSDLLKNHLFRIASKNINHVKTQWEKMLDNLGKSDATKFIRHYWNSQDKFIREKDLYKKIRKSIDSTKKVNDLISDLSTLSTLYNAIDKPNEAIYFSSTDLNEKIKDISILGAKSYYPIIISLVKENYDEKEILDFLHVLETLIVRNFVVAGKVANKYELSFSKIAEDITQQELTNIDEVKERIKGLIINNEDFKYFFETFSVKKKNVIRFLFRALHNYNNKETRILRDNNKIHIEHIMPQNIDNWDIDHDTYENYLWRFGNLTLLAEEYNKSIINKPFKQKKEIYKESKINLTRDLIHYDEWTDYEIIERQKKLANIALKVWSLN